MMTLAKDQTDQAFEQISEIISTRKPLKKEDIEKMVKDFSIEQILILSGRLAFLKAERKERYAENINEINDQAVYIGINRGSISDFYDEDVSWQFIGFKERDQRIDEIINFLYQISKDLN
jgi:hypothetical protein